MQQMNSESYYQECGHGQNNYGFFNVPHADMQMPQAYANPDQSHRFQEVDFEQFWQDAMVDRQLPVPVAFSDYEMSNQETPMVQEAITISEDRYSSEEKDDSPKKKWLPAGKKADRSDPELRNLSNTYFWERRNILLQMLESYTDDQTVLIISTPKSWKKAGTKGFVKRPRGSQYRGVSKNKSKWQVMIMGNFKKMYFGAIENEADAALFYDKLAIISHGIKARTNFNYTREDIIEILNDESLSRVWNQ